MLDILEDFLHDFQDASGLLPRAEEDPSRAPSGATGQERCVWLGKGKGSGVALGGAFNVC